MMKKFIKSCFLKYLITNCALNFCFYNTYVYATLPTDTEVSQSLLAKIRTQIQEGGYNSTNGEAIDPQTLKQYKDNLKESLKEEGSLYEPQSLDTSGWPGHLGDSSYKRVTHPIDQVLFLPNLTNRPIHIYTQEGGTCSIYSLCGAIDYLRVLDSNHSSLSARSPRFAYYLIRGAELNHGDIGALPKSLIGHLSTFGICSDHLWKFESDHKTPEGKLTTRAISEHPHQSAMQDAFKNKIIGLNYISLFKFLPKNISGNSVVQSINSSGRLLNLEVLLDYLDAYKRPILCTLNINVGDWDKLSNPPPLNPRAGKGSHAVLIIGYDLKEKVFFIQNSWGPTWGSEGKAKLSFELLAKTAESDFWQITKVGDIEKSGQFPEHYQTILDRYVIPFITRTQMNLEYVCQDHLSKACQTITINSDIHEAAAYIFNKNFAIQDGELIDYIVIFKRFISSKDPNKKLDDFKRVYSLMKRYGFTYKDLEKICKDGYEEWYKLEKLISILEQAKVNFNLAQYAAVSEEKVTFLEFAKKVRELSYQSTPSLQIPPALQNEAALLSMPIFILEQFVGPNCQFLFKHLTLTLPVHTQGKAIKIKQEFSGDLGVFDTEDRPIFNSQDMLVPVRFDNNGQQIIHVENQLTTGFNALQVSRTTLPPTPNATNFLQSQQFAWNPSTIYTPVADLLSTIQTIRVNGWNFDNFRLLLRQLEASYSRKQITIFAGYSGFNTNRDFSKMYQTPSYDHFNKIVSNLQARGILYGSSSN